MKLRILLATTALIAGASSSTATAQSTTAGATPTAPRGRRARAQARRRPRGSDDQREPDLGRQEGLARNLSICDEVGDPARGHDREHPAPAPASGRRHPFLAANGVPRQCGPARARYCGKVSVRASRSGFIPTRGRSKQPGADIRRETGCVPEEVPVPPVGELTLIIERYNRLRSGGHEQPPTRTASRPRRGLVFLAVSVPPPRLVERGPGTASHSSGLMPSRPPDGRE